MPTAQQLATNALRQQKGLVQTKGTGLTPTQPATGLASLTQSAAPQSQSIDQLFNTEAARQGKTVTDTTPGQTGGLSTLAASSPPAGSTASPAASAAQANTNAAVQPGSDPTVPGTGPPGNSGPSQTPSQLPGVPPIQTDPWGDIVQGLAGLAEKQWGGYGNTPQYGSAPDSTTGQAGQAAGQSTYTPYNLWNDQTANIYNRSVQLQGLRGLSDLANDPQNEQRIDQLSQDIYQPQEAAINKAAGQQRQQMLEGTFGRGVGSSSMTAALAGQLGQAQDQALSNAQQNAYVAARGQANQDLAAYQNLAQGLFGAGTSGLQAEANVGLANAQNQMAANQFGQGMQFTAQQNDANRALQQAMQSSGFQFTGDQAALQRTFDQNMATMGYAVQAGSQASNQRFQAAMQQSNQAWQQGQTQGGYQFQQQMLTQQQQYDAARLGEQQTWQTQENLAQHNFESGMLGSQQNFTALENAKSRGWQATQNEAQRQMQILLQTMQNAQAGDAQAKAMLNGNISAFIKGLVGIFNGVNTGNTPVANQS